MPADTRRLKDMLRSYRRGQSMREIGVQWGVSHQRVHQLLSPIVGVTPRHDRTIPKRHAVRLAVLTGRIEAGNTKAVEQRVELVSQLREQGFPWRRIAECAGVHHRALQASHTRAQLRRGSGS